MSDVFFKCQSCGQSLDAPEDMAGVEIECPACGRPLTVPAESNIPEPAPEDIEDAESADDREQNRKESTVKIDIPEDDFIEPVGRKVKIKRRGEGGPAIESKEGFKPSAGVDKKWWRKHSPPSGE